MDVAAPPGLNKQAAQAERPGFRFLQHGGEGGLGRGPVARKLRRMPRTQRRACRR